MLRDGYLYYSSPPQANHTGGGLVGGATFVECFQQHKKPPEGNTVTTNAFVYQWR